MPPQKKKTPKKPPKSKKATKIQNLGKHKVRNSAIIIFIGVFCLWLFWATVSGGLFSNITNKMGGAILQTTSQMGFQIREVNITGRNYTDPDLLRKLLNVEYGDPIFGFNPKDASDSMSEIPWIESINIRRNLPSTIYINLHERVPIALWSSEKNLAVIDKEGNILTTENLDDFSYLPLLIGKNAQNHAPDIIAMLNAEPKITDYLETIIRIGDRRWDLKLSNKTRIKLPEKNPELALSLLLKLHAKDNILERSWEYIDMRLDDKITMKPVHGSTETKNLQILRKALPKTFPKTLLGNSG